MAVAEPWRSGEFGFCGAVANRPEAVQRLIERFAEKHGELDVVYSLRLRTTWRSAAAVVNRRWYPNR